MIDLLRRWVEPRVRVKTPPLPKPDLTSEEERRRIESRQYEVYARLELLTIESEVPAAHRKEKRIAP